MPIRHIATALTLMFGSVALMLAQTGDDLFREARQKVNVDADISRRHPDLRAHRAGLFLPVERWLPNRCLSWATATSG